MKRLCVVLAIILQSACIGGARNVPPTTVYDFGLPAERLATEGKWSKLALEVRSPPWFDSLSVDYRLAYDDPLKPREYAASRWAGTPAALLAQRLRQQLGTPGAAGNTAADCLLRVELQEFSQVFDTARASRGVIQAAVSLIDGGRQVVGERQLSIAMQAATPDAPGGANALVAASDEFGRQLADWLGGVDKTGGARSCLRAN